MLSYQAKKNVKKLFYHIGRLLTAAIQLAGIVCFFLSSSMEEQKALLIIGGLLLIALGTFLESKISEYLYAGLYVLCVIFSPVRFFAQIVTIVLVIRSFSGSNEYFGNRGHAGEGFLGQACYVLLGFEWTAAGVRRRLSEEAAERQRIYEIHTAHAIEMEKRGQSAIDDLDGSVFSRMSFTLSDRGIRNQETWIGLYSGQPCVHITLTLDYPEGEYESYSRTIRNKYIDLIERRYAEYCRKVRNPVSKPTHMITITPGHVMW